MPARIATDADGVTIPIRCVRRAQLVVALVVVALAARAIWSVAPILPGIFWALAGVMVTVTVAVIVRTEVTIRRLARRR